MPRITTKVCRHCKEEKEESFFYRGPNSDGLHSWCKSCCSLKNKENKRKNPPKPLKRKLVVSVPEKRCSKCKAVKTANEFSRGYCKDGLTSQCKACHAVNTKKYSSKHQSERKEYMVRYKRSPEYRKRNAARKRAKSVEYHMLRSAKERAKRKGVVFALILEDINIPAVCPVLGIPLRRGRGSKGASSNSPTLDRINPELGYTKENVWVISWRANRIKSDATVEELRQILSALEKKVMSYAS